MKLGIRNLRISMVMRMKTNSFLGGHITGVQGFFLRWDKLEHV